MYLINNSCFELDYIVKSFEVAYRSHISSILISKFDTKSKFENEIINLENSLTVSSIVYSRKNKDKLNKIKNESQKYYDALVYCNKSLIDKDYEDDNVLYVSEINFYVDVFYDLLFKGLKNGFNSVEEFKYNSKNYHEIRNTLSHPASSKISIKDAKEVISFIRKLLNNIDDGKFWFIHKNVIITKMDEFICDIENTSLKFHNLSEVNFTHKKLICREKELELLQELIFGKQAGYRKSGSIIVYGYGGVGKTAIVLEFIQQIIKDISDKNINSDFEFILFYTSKEETLTFIETTGELYIKEVNKQISSFADFKSKLFGYLAIN